MPTGKIFLLWNFCRFPFFRHLAFTSSISFWLSCVKALLYCSSSSSIRVVRESYDSTAAAAFIVGIATHFHPETFSFYPCFSLAHTYMYFKLPSLLWKLYVYKIYILKCFICNEYIIMLCNHSRLCPCFLLGKGLLAWLLLLYINQHALHNNSKANVNKNWDESGECRRRRNFFPVLFHSLENID